MPASTLGLDLEDSSFETYQSGVYKGWGSWSVQARMVTHMENYLRLCVLNNSYLFLLALEARSMRLGLQHGQE